MAIKLLTFFSRCSSYFLFWHTRLVTHAKVSQPILGGPKDFVFTTKSVLQFVLRFKHQTHTHTQHRSKYLKVRLIMPAKTKAK